MFTARLRVSSPTVLGHTSIPQRQSRHSFLFCPPQFVLFNPRAISGFAVPNCTARQQKFTGQHAPWLTTAPRTQEAFASGCPNGLSALQLHAYQLLIRDHNQHLSEAVEPQAWCPGASVGERPGQQGGAEGEEDDEEEEEGGEGQVAQQQQPHQPRQPPLRRTIQN